MDIVENPFTHGNCPACDSEYLVFIRHVGSVRSGVTLRLYYCLSCQSFTCPGSYKESEDALRNDAAYHVGLIEQKTPLFARLAAKLAKHSSGPLADVGCGVGTLINAARPWFHIAVGYDTNLFAIAEGLKLFPPLALKNKPFGQDSLHFDVITAVDMLEHIAQPRQMVSLMAQRLHHGGILYITVPWFHTDKYPWLKEPITMQQDAAHGSPLCDCEVHVNHYTVTGLKRCGEAAGLVFEADWSYQPWPLNGVLFAKP